MQTYCRAKLMAIMFTRDEATQPEADGVNLVAAHRGSVYTDALRDMRRAYTRLTGKTGFPPARDVREGIAPLLRLVIDQACAGDSGSYFVLAERKEPSAVACDAGLAAELRHRTMPLPETLWSGAPVHGSCPQALRRSAEQYVFPRVPTRRVRA